MSEADGRPPLGEFEQIAQLYRPLTRGAPEALDLLDDAAIIPQRPGFDLVITKDALVEGVHFPSGEAPALVARKLLRTNLSDLAAKGADPYGYFLAVSWPRNWDFTSRQAFASGLAQDGEAFDLSLLGGDTTSTPGPMVASATLLGWAPCGRAIRRSGACVGDLVLVSGTIGDGMLGLRAVQGLVEDADGFLADRYRLPRPRLDLRDMLRAHASAAADVSDGLVADAGHLARASGVALRIDLAKLPLSAAAGEWLERQPDRAQAALALATGGDDYEIVFTAPPHAAAACGQTVIGEVISGTGVTATYAGRVLEPGAGGWRHA